MILNFVKTISTELKDKMRIIKYARYGKDDIQTSIEASPSGVDSNPIKDMVAVYAPTGTKGETVIIGYLNKNQKAEVGELRVFATNDSGTEKFYVWLRSSGEIEIGGTSNYAVKFNELKTEFNALKQSHNDLLNEYKTHTHIATLAVSGSSATGTTNPTISTQTPNTSNIDNAKNDKIKTI